MNTQTEVLYHGEAMDLRQKAALVFLRGLIWGIAGGFFGMVFLSILGHLQHGGDAFWKVPLGAAVAGAVVGAFYSAKRVANIGAIAGSMTGVFVLVLAHPATPPPWVVLAACGGVGLVTGALASGLFRSKRGAVLVALAGFGAGALAGSVAEVVAWLASGFDRVLVLTFVMAPLTGVLFALGVIAFYERTRIELPAWLNVGVVAAGISAVVGVGMWMLSATLSLDLDPVQAAAIQSTVRDLPQAFAGGLLGGALVGALLELMGVRWLYRL